MYQVLPVVGCVRAARRAAGTGRSHAAAAAPSPLNIKSHDEHTKVLL